MFESWGVAYTPVWLYMSFYGKLNSTCILIGSFMYLLEDKHIGDVTITNFCFFIK